jgi:hypothetical protein
MGERTRRFPVTDGLSIESGLRAPPDLETYDDLYKHSIDQPQDRRVSQPPNPFRKRPPHRARVERHLQAAAPPHRREVSALQVSQLTALLRRRARHAPATAPH